MYSVGIDVGGTYLKTARLGPLGRVGPVVRTPIPSFMGASGPAREIDPVQLMDAIWSILSPMLDHGGIESILVTGQMAGIAFVSASGEAVAPLISWQDERGGHVHRVQRLIGSDALGNLGDGLRSNSPLVLLKSLGMPHGARFTSLLAFVAGSIAGTRANTVHVSDAAAWGMYDLRQNKWSDKALQIAGISERSLPDVTWDLVPIGAHAHIDKSPIPVYCAVGDQQASLRGTGFGYGIYSEVVSVNLATGCQVGVLSETWQSTEQLRPYFEGRYLHTVTHLPAGRLLTNALVRVRGSSQNADWEWAMSAHDSDEDISHAVATIVDGIIDAVHRLNAVGRPILFSGGLVQQFAPIRERVTSILSAPAFIFKGDDAALAGLAALQPSL